MTGRTERLLLPAAVLLVASMFAGVAGLRSGPAEPRDRSSGIPAYYHGGKTVAEPLPDPGCRSGKCHAVPPHRKGPEAAFRNLHLSFVECAVCHEGDGGGDWHADRRSDGRWVIRAGAGPRPGDPHRRLGTAVRCRGCHSRGGRDRIERGTNETLPGGFPNPVALRMLEEGSRSWVPDGM
ncbi:MAG: hypothetical protein Kow00128_11410 [Deltaproteobacteria bacterium]